MVGRGAVFQKISKPALPAAAAAGFNKLDGGRTNPS